MDFGERLRKMRKDKNMSQVDLQNASGISQQSISFIETGINSPTIYNAEKLAGALGVSLAELLGYTPGQQSIVYDVTLTETERKLISDFRQLNKQGREYVLQSVYMAVQTFGGEYVNISDMEDISGVNAG